MSEQTLVGLWFHSYAEVDGTTHVNWQGHVMRQAEPGWYIVQLYSWITGQPNGCKLVSFDDMTGWTFYRTHEDMNEAYARRYGQQEDIHGNPVDMR